LLMGGCAACCQAKSCLWHSSSTSVSLGPPTELTSDPPSPKGSSHGYED
jgi:hypothetical protein